MWRSQPDLAASAADNATADTVEAGSTGGQAAECSENGSVSGETGGSVTSAVQSTGGAGAAQGAGARAAAHAATDSAETRLRVLWTGAGA